MCACVLHNICILQDNIIGLDEEVDNNINNEEPHPHRDKQLVGEFERGFLELGKIKRNTLCKLIN